MTNYPARIQTINAIITPSTESNPWKIYGMGAIARVSNSVAAFNVLVGLIMANTAHDREISVVDPPPDGPPRPPHIDSLQETYKQAKETARKIVDQALRKEAQHRHSEWVENTDRITREIAGLHPEEPVKMGALLDVKDGIMPVPDYYTHRLIRIVDGQEVVISIGTEKAITSTLRRSRAYDQASYRMEKLT